MIRIRYHFKLYFSNFGNGRFHASDSMSIRGIAPVYFSLAMLLLSTGANTLQLRELVVPSKLGVGSTATLSCLIETGNSSLESIKWYKDEKELCKFNSRMNRFYISIQPTPFQNLKCENLTLWFGPIPISASGTYKCEASAMSNLHMEDQPNIQTVMGSRNLSVFAYPMDAPVISGLKTYYHFGEFIEASCTAPPSYPAPDMMWHLNGKEIDSHRMHMTVAEEKGLIKATINLKILADAKFFSNPGGYALLSCTSTLMDTPPMKAEAKTHFSFSTSTTTANVDYDDLRALRKTSPKGRGNCVQIFPPWTTMVLIGLRLTANFII